MKEGIENPTDSLPGPPQVKVSVLVISGSMGAGKTTLLGEISDVLTASSIHHAAIELDTLALGNLPPGCEDIHTKNLAAMWANFARVGMSRLLISGAIDSQARLDDVRSSIPGASIVICRLRASLATMQARVRMREPGMLQEQFVARSQVLEAELDAAALEDFVVENDGRSVTDVAREILDRVGWSENRSNHEGQ